MPTQEFKARFIKPMLLQSVPTLPEGPNWTYEVKLLAHQRVGRFDRVREAS